MVKYLDPTSTQSIVIEQTILGANYAHTGQEAKSKLS